MCTVPLRTIQTRDRFVTLYFPPRAFRTCLRPSRHGSCPGRVWCMETDGRLNTPRNPHEDVQTEKDREDDWIRIQLIWKSPSILSQESRPKTPSSDPILHFWTYSQQRSIFSYQCILILLIGDRPSPHSDSNLFRMFMGGHGIFRPRLLLMKVRPPTYCPRYLSIS